MRCYAACLSILGNILYSGVAGMLGMFTLLGMLAFATERRKQEARDAKPCVRCYEPRLVTHAIFLTCLVLLARLACLQSLTSKAFVRCYEPRLVTQTVFLTCLVLLAGLARLEFGTFGMFVGLVGMVAFAFAFASCCMQHLHLQMH